MTYGQVNDSFSGSIIKGLVLNERGIPIGKAKVDIWQVVLEKQYRGPPRMNFLFETEGETDVDGVFEIALVGGFDYQIYIYTSGLRYVPAKISDYIEVGSIKEVSLQLFPSASIILEGDVVFVDSATPWKSVSPITFSVSPMMDNWIEVYSDPIDHITPLNRLGLNPRQIIVPANKPIQIEVNAENRLFIIDDLPVMMRGQTFQLEIKKYLVQSNFPIIENLLDNIGTDLSLAEQRGFYIVAERRDLTSANDLHTLAKEKIVKGLYDECYADLRQAYVISDQVRQRLVAMNVETVSAALILPVFFSFAAAVMAFFMFEDEVKKALTTIVSYTVLLVVFYFMYPGCQIVSFTSFLLAAFIYLGVTLFVSFLLPRLFKERGIEGRIAFRSAISALFLMAKRGLKRRRLRFILNVITVGVSIMGFVALTSVSMGYGLIFGETSAQSISDGILIRESRISIEKEWEVPFFPLHNSDIDWLQERVDVSLVAPKTENKPRHETSPLGKLVGDSSQDFFGVLGILPSAEANITHLNIIVEEGRYLKDNDTNQILLSKKAAKELDATVGSELLWISGKTSLKVKVVGIFNASNFDKLSDLDGQPIIPQKLYMSVPPADGQPPIWEPTYCEPDEVIIATWQTAFQFSSETCTVWLSRLDARVENPERILPLAREIALVRVCQVWASHEGSVSFSKLGAYPEIGGTSIIVPLLIVILNVAVTMLTSVYERRREVYILSSIALDPTHIMTLFLAEALIIGMIGSTIGYLFGVSLYRVFPFFSGEILVRQKLSMGWCLAAMILGVTVTVASSVFQAKGASTIATPSLLRRWRMDSEPVRGESVTFQMPVKVPKQDIESFTNYMMKGLHAWKDSADISIEHIERIDHETPEESKTRIKFRYLYRVPHVGFIVNNELVVSRKKNQGESRVELVFMRDLEKKDLRRVANLIRKLILKWSTEIGFK
jgi:ABC-type lipoprotein release transport system permease subunit